MVYLYFARCVKKRKDVLEISLGGPVMKPSCCKTILENTVKPTAGFENSNDSKPSKPAVSSKRSPGSREFPFFSVLPKPQQLAL